MKAVLKSSVFLFMSLCLLTLPACGNDTNAKGKDPAATTTSDAAQKLPKLLDLGSHKCAPCRMMAPTLDELTKEYKGVFDVEFIDVWLPENKDTGHFYGVRLIPTQIFFDAGGTELWRHEGFMSKEDILKKWQELGFSFRTPTQEKSSQKSAVTEHE
jgi:thioredoxin 1